MAPALLAGLTGVVQGARHALEPDHVTAVATLMAEAPCRRRGLFFAACWGLGHASMLLLVGGPLLLLRVELPGPITTTLEVAVGAMLVALGVRALRARTASRRGEREGRSLLQRGRRPFAIGVVHGLAGSGALAAALIALGTPHQAAGIAALSLYSLGTVLGMVGLAAAAGPLLARAGSLPRLATRLAPASGALSVVVGVAWIARTLLGQ